MGHYLEWDFSDFIYLFFFSEFVRELSPVCGMLFSQIFFLIVLVLLNWGLMKLRPFKLLFFFMVRSLKF